jgi:thiamine-monophosphate kinase
LNAEDFFIGLFANHAEVIGDDGALIDGYVYSKDAFFENIHFKRSWMTLEQIAYRSMMVNISDAVAMNALPRYALLSVAMPSSLKTSDMRSLHAGFQRAADMFDIKIIGGDTISNTKLDITVTIISTTSKPLLRKGLKKGYLLAYTGQIGRSRKELRYLLAGGKIHAQSKFVSFSLRTGFVKSLCHSRTTGMDISDGIYSDLQKMSDVNRLSYRFITKLTRNVACSGEEYEMLIGFSPRDRKRVMRQAKKHRTPVTVIAKAVRGRFKNRCKAHHF